MYYYIEGVLTYKDATVAVVDCGGVGYKLITSHTTYERLPELNGKIKLYTHLVVKEDALDLLGFYDLAEKNAFLMLTSVSGIGVKVAMSVLSSLTPERFAFAVASGDYKELSVAQGVSTKTAQKIIFELKDKIAKSDISSKSTSPSIGAAGSAAGNTGNSFSHGTNSKSDAVNALMVLQYSRAEATNALKDIDMSMPLEDVIKAALKNLMKS